MEQVLKEGRQEGAGAIKGTTVAAQPNSSTKSRVLKLQSLLHEKYGQRRVEAQIEVNTFSM